MYTLKNIFCFVCNSNKFLARPLSTSLSVLKQFTFQDILTDKEVETYKKLFDNMDIDKDGSLTKEEIKKGLQEFVDYTASEEELHETMETLDVNKNGFIEFNEFVNYMAFSKKLRTERAIKIVFDIYDKNKDGYLSKEELTKALNTLGIKPTQSNFENLMKMADKNEDGKISFKDFEELFDVRQIHESIDIHD